MVVLLTHLNKRRVVLTFYKPYISKQNYFNDKKDDENRFTLNCIRSCVLCT